MKKALKHVERSRRRYQNLEISPIIKERQDKYSKNFQPTKSIYESNSIPSEFQHILPGTRKYNFQLNMKTHTDTQQQQWQQNRIAKTLLNDRQIAWRYHILNLYYRSIVIKTTCYWYKKQTHLPMESNWSIRNKLTHQWTSAFW